MDKTTQMRQKSCLTGLTVLGLLVKADQVQQTYALLSSTNDLFIFVIFKCLNYHICYVIIKFHHNDARLFPDKLTHVPSPFIPLDHPPNAPEALCPNFSGEAKNFDGCKRALRPDA